MFLAVCEISTHQQERKRPASKRSRRLGGGSGEGGVVEACAGVIRVFSNPSTLEQPTVPPSLGSGMGWEGMGYPDGKARSEENEGTSAGLQSHERHTLTRLCQPRSISGGHIRPSNGDDVPLHDPSTLL